MPADGGVTDGGGCRARKVLLVSVAIGVLVAGGVTAGLVFGLGGSKPPSGNPLENPGTDYLVFTGDQLQPVGASQSSTLLDRHSEFGAANCIDGEVGADFATQRGRRICNTNDESYPWLAMDFGKTVNVQRVEIFNRLGCCGDRTRGVRVSISDELPTSSSQQFQGTLLGTFDGPAANGQHITISGNSGQEISGRYVIVQMSNGGTPRALNLKEVRAFSRSTSTGDQLQPVGASQSSTLLDRDFEFGAANCIDGEVGADSGPRGRRICNTNDESYPWLAMDFGKTVNVQRVEIFNRLGCCGDRTRGVRVSISDKLPTSSSQLFRGSLLGTFDGPAANGQQITISLSGNPGQGLSGRYVIVQMSNGGTLRALNLKEVRAFGRSTSTGISTCKCGMEIERRIVGGYTSESGKYPWMVTLWNYGDASNPRRGCGATLIASRWVVTAAHCTWYDKNGVKGVKYKHTKDTLRVVLGEFDISTSNDQYDTNRKEVRLQIDPIVHEIYINSTEQNDIALLKLAEDVDLDIYTPACLPPSGADYTGQNGRVYGWGSLQSCPPKNPNVLREVEISIISDAACRLEESHSVIGFDEHGNCSPPYYGSYARLISDEMLCAGGKDPGKSSCQGDSGGPLTVKGRTPNRHELVGVVSWGYGCAVDGMSSVFAEVAKLRGWIDMKIAANGEATFCA